MSSENKRVVNRYFVAVLYPEDENYNFYMEYIIKNFLEVTYIIHDRDIDENGEIKKIHTHILFKVGDNARHLARVAKDIGIQENYLQGCNKDAMLMYLIHLNNPNKTRYKIEEVQGELKNRLKKLIDKQKPEEERYKNIIDAIMQRKIKNVTQLICYGIGYNCIEEIKRAQFLLCKAIEELNPKQKENIDN